MRPGKVAEDEFAAAHRRLDEVLPGTGPVAGALHHLAREPRWCPPDRLPRAVASLAEDLRDRTKRLFGLPDGERVDFELVTNQPWSGFNYYLGGLRSRVVINVDLPVLSTSLGHLVAHEAYPGPPHRAQPQGGGPGSPAPGQLEETIFLVGTPQCLLAEGLADLGLEVVVGPRPEPMVAVPSPAARDPLRRRPGRRRCRPPVTTLSAVRANAALLLHDEGRR